MKTNYTVEEIEKMSILEQERLRDRLKQYGIFWRYYAPIFYNEESGEYKNEEEWRKARQDLLDADKTSKILNFKILYGKTPSRIV